MERRHTSSLVVIGSMVGLLGASVGYQRFLNSDYGDYLYARGTWARVAIAVGIALVWLAIEDHRAAGRALRCFAFMGLPFVAREFVSMYGDEDDMRVIGED